MLENQQTKYFNHFTKQISKKKQFNNQKAFFVSFTSLEIQMHLKALYNNKNCNLMGNRKHELYHIIWFIYEFSIVLKCNLCFFSICCSLLFLLIFFISFSSLAQNFIAAILRKKINGKVINAGKFIVLTRC